MPLTVDSDFSPIKVSGTTSADTEIVTPASSLIKIKFVYWYNPTTIGHLAMLKDGFGHEILPMRCEVPNESQVWPVWTAYDSIRCDDLDSGTLYIYH